MPLPVYVLTGGRSQRFGLDKATLEVDGEPWALHVGRRLAAEGEEVVLVGDGFGLEPRVLDDAPGVPGPLAGVLAALTDRRERFGEGPLVLASCDLVRPERDWLIPLRDALAEGEQDAAAYHAAERWQPFPSVAHTRWAPRLAALAASGVSSLQRALSESRVARVAWTGAAGGPPQANTREELGRLMTSPPVQG